MADLYPPLGMPRPIHCAICGARVREEWCELHGRPDSEYVRLVDRYVPMEFSRRALEREESVND